MEQVVYDGQFVCGYKEGFGIEEKNAPSGGYYMEGLWKADKLDGPECRVLRYDVRRELVSEYKGGFKAGNYHG